MATDINLRHLYFDEVGSMNLTSGFVYCLKENKLMAVPMHHLAFLCWFESAFEGGYDIDGASSGNYYLHKPTNRVVALEHWLFDEFCIASFVDIGVFDTVSLVKRHALRGLNMPLLRKLKIAELI